MTYDAYKTTDAQGEAADALYASLILRYEAAMADVIDRLDGIRCGWETDADGAFEVPDCVVWAIDDLCSTFGVVNPRKPGKRKGDSGRGS